MSLVVPVWDMAARDADVVPTSFDELPAIKSRWVVMQHAKKGSSVHDLPSVPDFDLLDPAWMELNPAPEVVGKTKLIEKHIHAANFSGQGLVDIPEAGLGEQAKDGELETLVNHEAQQEADPPPPPPAPMFRDDEMESWLLYPLDEPLDSGLKQEAWQEAATAVAAAAGAEQLGTQPEGAEKKGSSQGGSKAPADSAQHGQKNGGAPVGDGAKQGMGRQDALRHLTGAIGPASTPVKRSGVGLSGGISSSAERPGAADGGAVKSSAANMSMEASKGMMEKALKFQQQQQLQLQRLQQQLLQQQKKQNEQAQQQHQQQVAAEQQQTAALLKEELRQQEQELLAHLLLEQRFQQEKKQQQQMQQQQQQQQQNQQVEQAGVTRQGSGFTCQQSGQSMAPPSAPLNFSHFSRPAHMYSRANLKNMGAALTGNGSAQQKSQQQQSQQQQPQQQQQQQRQSVPPQQQQQQQQQHRDQHQHRQQPEMPSASAGRGIMSVGAKLPAALLAKYQSLSSGSSVAESIQRPKLATAATCTDARPSVSGAQSGGSPVAVSHDSVARGSPGVAAMSFGNGSLKPASVQHLVSGAAYAPLGAKTGNALDRQDVREMSGSEPAHMSTVTSSLLARRAQQAKAEREATVSSTHGMPLRRAVMETSAARMVASGPGASVVMPEVSARSVGTGSGFKRSRDVETTDYTQSEDVPEESGDTRKTGKKMGGGAKEENSAAKRARAAEVHNMSERRRRDRINERMKMLQELIPNSNKTDKASMLDEAIEYLKMLQLQLQVMSMRSGMSIPPNLAPTGASSNLTALAVSIAQQQQPQQQQPQASQMSASLAQLGMGGSQTGGSGSMGGSSSAGGIMGMMASAGGQALMGMTMGGGAGMGMAMGMGGAMGGMGAMGAMGAMANLFDQDISSLPAQQRLLLEMARADMEQGMNGATGVSGASLQQQALEEQLQQQQQQQLMGLAGKFGNPFLQQSGGGSSGNLGARNTAALMSQLQAGNGPVGAMMAMRGLGLSASGGQRRGSNSGMMGSTELSSGESLGQSRLGAAAAAAVAMEGHRQLNPSAVDPLDAYLARHQRMQQQQQQMKPQPSLDQASVDLEMYQAILKRQHQAM